MKLGELRSAIRGHKGTVLVEATLGGKVVLIPVQKTAFMSDTLEAFGEHKGVESGLTCTEEGVVKALGGTATEAAISQEEGAPAVGDAADDDDDLLGDSGSDSAAEADDDGFDDLLG